MKTMKKFVCKYYGVISALLALSSCTPAIELRTPAIEVPMKFGAADDGATVQTGNATNPAATVNWKEFFGDEKLAGLIDVALRNNQELSIFLQEIEIAKNEAEGRTGAYLPSMEFGAGTGFDKVGRNTRFGAVEERLEIAPGKGFPEPLTNFRIGPRVSWELDIWRKLRNEQKSAYTKFLVTQEGQKFLVTNLIAEVANSYYELCALNSQLSIVQQNVRIQRDALQTVKHQKDAARVSELAVRRFEAQFLKTEALQYDLEQKVIEKENKVNFLLGRFPQPIPRDTSDFVSLVPRIVMTGVPSQLLNNRADIRQAKLEIAAAELDVKVAEAAFYPSLTLDAEIGYEAYRVNKMFTTPESLLYGITGGITGPLFNRRAITAEYLNAGAKQQRAVFNFERTVLNAFAEAATQIANVRNMEKSAALKAKQVEALTSSVDIAGTLFTSARADYSEVLLTQREALEARFELVETKLRQMQAVINLYRALGGGWDRRADSASVTRGSVEQQVASVNSAP